MKEKEVFKIAVMCGNCKYCDISHQASLIVMICLTFLFFTAKIVIGHRENSIALIADSFHLISDFAALIIGLIAVRFAAGKVEGRYTFGYVRAEVLGGLINAIFLVALCFSISVESLKRLVVTERIDDPVPVLIVGIVGFVINTIGLVLFRSKRKSFICKHKRYVGNRKAEYRTQDTQDTDKVFLDPSEVEAEAERNCEGIKSKFLFIVLCRPIAYFSIKGIKFLDVFAYNAFFGLDV